MRSELYEWRPVVGYEGLYEVNNLGEVRSLDRTVNCNGGSANIKGRILTQHQAYNGYLRVALCSNGIMKNKLAHRLVAEAFVPNDDPEHKTQCNHKDEDKTNNRASNLEWCNQKYNNEYGTRVLRATINNRNNPKQNCRRVNRYTLDGEFIDTWPSLKEVERSLGFSFTNIQCVCKRKTGKSNGYQWRYVEDCNGTENIGVYAKEKPSTSKCVMQYTKDGVFVKEYESTREAARAIGIGHSRIQQCCLQKYGCKSAGGYIWKYK